MKTMLTGVVALGLVYWATRQKPVVTVTAVNGLGNFAPGLLCMVRPQYANGYHISIGGRCEDRSRPLTIRANGVQVKKEQYTTMAEAVAAAYTLPRGPSTDRDTEINPLDPVAVLRVARSDATMKREVATEWRRAAEAARMTPLAATAADRATAAEGAARAAEEKVRVLEAAPSVVPTTYPGSSPTSPSWQPGVQPAPSTPNNTKVAVGAGLAAIAAFLAFK